jgi:hypothetical protein
MDLSHITQGLAAALTPLLAILAAYIAYQQHRTARHRLRLDLYDRRFRVYVALVDCLCGILSAQNITVEELDQRLRALQSHTTEVAFLFGSEVSDFISTIIPKVARLSVVRTQLNSPRSSDPVQANALEEMDHILNWMVRQLQMAEGVFRPYLPFKWLR